MARIAAIVINSVGHDARVLKQADSLQQAGHDVTIFGVKDARNRLGSESRPSGVQVVRVGWRAAAYRRLAAMVIMCAAIGILALSALALWLPYERLAPIFDFLGERYYMPLIGLLAIVALAAVAFKKARRYIRLARQHADLESESPDRREPLRLHRRLLALAGIYYKVFNWRRAIAPAVAALRPDVVHCHDVYTLPIGAALKRQLGCKLVYDAHEIYEEVAQHDAATGAAYRHLQRRLNERVDAFITINDSIAEFYRQRYPGLADATIIKNATLPVPPFSYDGRLHEAAGLPTSQRILLYQGGFAPRRGLEVLVESARYLPPTWTLVLMGWGTLEPELRDLADGVTRLNPARPQPAVCFVPAAPQAELPRWTAGGTLGVIPYERVGLNHWFCTPNKLWEYPSAGVPLLVSPFPEMAKTVTENGIGWLLPDPTTPEALAEAVGRVSDGELERAKAACAEFIDSDNWQVYAERLVALYAHRLAAATPPTETALASTSRSSA